MENKIKKKVIVLYDSECGFCNKIALYLKEKCREKYNEILTNDYYSSLKASYTSKELKDFIFENKLSSLEVFEEGDQYLVIYGKV